MEIKINVILSAEDKLLSALESIVSGKKFTCLNTPEQKLAENLTQVAAAKMMVETTKEQEEKAPEPKLAPTRSKAKAKAEVKPEPKEEPAPEPEEEEEEEAPIQKVTAEEAEADPDDEEENEIDPNILILRKKDEGDAVKAKLKILRPLCRVVANCENTGIFEEFEQIFEDFDISELEQLKGKEWEKFYDAILPLYGKALPIYEKVQAASKA